MTTTQQPTASIPSTADGPPLARAAQLVAGVSLVLAGLLNGGAQYVGHLLSADSDDWTRWAAEHQAWAAVEQSATLLSLLFLPIGILGIAQVTRWHRPRLTAVATVLSLWGMWGFHTVLGLWYASGGVAPDALGVEGAVRLDDAYGADAGVIALALVPHLLGSFLGLLLLCLAARGSFPTPALVLLAGFLVWDFLGVPAGPLEAHLLLAVALAWLGLHLLRMPASQWRGGLPTGA
jgi:hypothetical protein